ncbi:MULTISPECIES: LexA family protein [Hymenobacter]|uniref:Translesion error-prone DNA polymerase V autoproteolytic subunit n=2 Tax=Hymenobacter TaxID=89966 RepID=A0A7Y7U7A5_9BACT|nr:MULTISPECIES: translesion error-prone DNA polymerase V autoproteolytic subunit [Hymenobacter]NVO32325.1 translesion error-prone DNA polymerase V autoproteolytic subunit [Hymenobacter lapidiphilus]OWP61706.1 umuDC operon-like protein [Hymenobacter amundsenii]
MTTIELIDVGTPITTLWLPVYASLVPCGFPSPASDELEELFDLNRLLFRHPEATYLIRVSGESMQGAEIHAGDLLAVDKHIEADHNHIVVAVIEGECTVKRLVRRGSNWWLQAENPAYPDYPITEPENLRIWGVVTHVVHELIPGKLTALLRSRD